MGKIPSLEKVFAMGEAGANVVQLITLLWLTPQGNVP